MEDLCKSCELVDVEGDRRKVSTQNKVLCEKLLQVHYFEGIICPT